MTKTLYRVWLFNNQFIFKVFKVHHNYSQFSSVQSLSRVWLFATPWITARYHQLLEFTQTHVHWVVDAIQPSHPRSSPSPPAPNPSQHQGLFQWVNSLHKVAKVLEFPLIARSRGTWMALCIMSHGDVPDWCVTVTCMGWPERTSSTNQPAQEGYSGWHMAKKKKSDNSQWLI